MQVCTLVLSLRSGYCAAFIQFRFVPVGYVFAFVAYFFCVVCMTRQNVGLRTGLALCALRLIEIVLKAAFTQTGPGFRLWPVEASLVRM